MFYTFDLSQCLGWSYAFTIIICSDFGIGRFSDFIVDLVQDVKYEDVAHFRFETCCRLEI